MVFINSKAKLFLSKRRKQNNPLILTWQAVINVTVTVSSSEAWTTFTQVTALNIMAQSMIFAGLRETFIDIHCTSLPWNTESPEVRPLIVSVTERLDANTAQCSKYIMFHITFPARGTLAGVAFRIRRFLANSWVLTWIRGTWSNHYLAVHTWSTEREKKKKEHTAKGSVLLRRTKKDCHLHDFPTQQWTAFPLLKNLSRRLEHSSWAQWVQADSKHSNSH